jgi:hypothetical protein
MRLPGMSHSFTWRIVLAVTLLAGVERIPAADQQPPKRVAAIVTAYYHNSHADLLVSRLLQTDTLDGKGKKRAIELASLYVDQFPENDISRRLMAEHGVPIYPTVVEALQGGTGELAVDGVLLIAEHGQYPVSATGQVQYPKRRMFEEIVRAFEASGRVAPVFVDKHLADNWEDARWLYETARRMHVPLMAGSSLPCGYRYPPVDIERGAALAEIVAISYHTLDAYGFHALELVQTLAERRGNGETGIRSVRCLTGQSVWEAEEQGVYDRKLLDAALGRMKRALPEDKKLSELVPEPVLWTVEFVDGLKANVLTLNNAVGEWAAAWRYADGKSDSTLFWTQEARPFIQFSYQLDGIETLINTGRPAWPVERTLLTSGALDALLISKRDDSSTVETPHLQFTYTTEWDWREPSSPPPDRPLDGP